jgi:DNA polymerase-3 subunit epsilon
MIHGIEPEKTADAPNIVEVWDEVSTFIGGRTLVAHNATFDMSVFRNSFHERGAPIPSEYECLCTYRLARSVWPTRYSYRLPDIISDLGYDTDGHHDLLWDAQAALEVGDAMARDLDVKTLREVAEARGFFIGKLYPDPDNWDPFSNYVSSGGGGHHGTRATSKPPAVLSIQTTLSTVNKLLSRGRCRTV